MPDAELDASGRNRMENESDKIAAFVKSALEANPSLVVQDAVKKCLFQNPRSCDILVEGPGQQDQRSKWPFKMLGRVKVKSGMLLGKRMDVEALINTWL
ncbi:hypothetical protein HZA42_02120 [Candidatus Peregrinibacteria bacterium]|nr:hypothetical protein [Candidatus Peregrinibacteria bacterium]